MKVSDKLQAQIIRLMQTGSFSISMNEKRELAELTKHIGCTELINLDCGTCIRNAMYDVSAYQQQMESRPVLQFKGVKDPATMTYQELRKAVKDKGIKTTKGTTKADLIKLLS